MKDQIIQPEKKRLTMDALSGFRSFRQQEIYLLVFCSYVGLRLDDCGKSFFS